MSTVPNLRNLCLDGCIWVPFIISSKFLECLKFFTIKNYRKLQNKNSLIVISYRPNETYPHTLVTMAGYHLQSTLPVNSGCLWLLSWLLAKYLYMSYKSACKPPLFRMAVFLLFLVLISSEGRRSYYTQDSAPVHQHARGLCWKIQIYWSARVKCAMGAHMSRTLEKKVLLGKLDQINIHLMYVTAPDKN